LRKKWHKSQQVKELESGEIEMTLTVNGLIGIESWLCQWIPHVKVMSPEELKEAFKADILAELAYMEK